MRATQTYGLPWRASNAAHPHKLPRVVPIPRRKNVVTEVPIATSSMKINCRAAHAETLC